MSDLPLLYEIGDDGVATITLNRPEHMNSLSPPMLDLWVDALTDAATNSSVGAVVVTGAGERAFCTGADLSSGSLPAASRESTAADGRNGLRYTIHRIPRALRQLDKPYIAAVNGAAAGAGMDMANMADIRLISDTARFTMSYVKMGVVPGDGGAYYLPRIVGLSRALHLMWTGELFGADKALAWGYALDAFSPDRLMPEAHAYAARLANGPRISIELIKGMVYRGLDATETEALIMAQHAMALARTTADAKEGPRAFKEKREPQFEGR